MKYRLKETRGIRTESIIELGNHRFEYSAQPIYHVQERQSFFSLWFWWATIKSTWDKAEAESYLKALRETELYE